ncbi:hypothetical protein [Maricaulis salignorans]|uniref:Uncharacterized protein n=1 Tax=Maricaulis salignorans TaxID=144026 RepID=A0A1G9LH90_9PROT|nr:hypothetical protein [Maricaulis salignorans]SDL61339.1 hypothetical protein SAMN04488568_10159 [Maricaulis salignorans]
MVRITVPALAALLLLSACASHDGPSPRGRDGIPGGGPGSAGGFNMAVGLVDQGDYEQALPILRCVAGQGSGFEIAEYLAGYSAIQLASAESTPAILRDEMRVEGLDRLTRAARAGWPAAQAELAVQFSRIESEQAPERAAYWAAVYRRNIRDRTYGLDRLDNSVEAQISSRMDGARSAQIETEAASFIAEPLAAIATTPACAPWLGSPRSGRQGGRGRDGSDRGERPGGGGRGGSGGRPGG